MSGRIAFGLATGAVACAAAFTVWALAFPAYTSGETLLEASAGLPVRLAVPAPLTASVAGWLLLHVACRCDARWARASASALAASGSGDRPGVAIAAHGAGGTPMFVFFSNRLGCLPSLMLSVGVTALLLLIFDVI